MTHVYPSCIAIGCLTGDSIPLQQSGNPKDPMAVSSSDINDPQLASERAPPSAVDRDPTDPVIPLLLNVQRRVGRGAFCDVFAAQHLLHVAGSGIARMPPEHVAIKVMLDPERRNTMLQFEAEILASLGTTSTRFPRLLHYGPLIIATANAANAAHRAAAMMTSSVLSMSAAGATRPSGGAPLAPAEVDVAAPPESTPAVSGDLMHGSATRERAASFEEEKSEETGRGFDVEMTVVMELLTGESMSALRDLYRDTMTSKLKALPHSTSGSRSSRQNSETVPPESKKAQRGGMYVSVAAHLASEMLRCVRDLHARDVVHRDIKPSNFVRRNRTSTEYAFIDFGLAKQRCDCGEDDVPSFRGTSLYASPFIPHDKSRRSDEGGEETSKSLRDSRPWSVGWESRVIDDVWSIVFVFIDLVVGYLPWTDLVRIKEKSVVGILKLEMCAVNPNGEEAIVVEELEASSPQKKRAGARGKKASPAAKKKKPEPLHIIPWIIDQLNDQEGREDEGPRLRALRSAVTGELSAILHTMQLRPPASQSEGGGDGFDYDRLLQVFDTLIGKEDVTNIAYSVGSFSWAALNASSTDTSCGDNDADRDVAVGGEGEEEGGMEESGKDNDDIHKHKDKDGNKEGDGDAHADERRKNRDQNDPVLRSQSASVVNEIAMQAWDEVTKTYLPPSTTRNGFRALANSIDALTQRSQYVLSTLSHFGADRVSPSGEIMTRPDVHSSSAKPIEFPSSLWLSGAILEIRCRWMLLAARAVQLDDLLRHQGTKTATPQRDGNAATATAAGSSKKLVQQQQQLRPLSNDRIFALKRILDSHDWFFCLPSSSSSSRGEISGASNEVVSSDSAAESESEPSRKRQCVGRGAESSYWSQFLKEQEIVFRFVRLYRHAASQTLQFTPFTSAPAVRPPPKSSSAGGSGTSSKRVS